MDEQQRVLHSPFNADIHAKTFVYYCEVIIYPDGKIEYAVPSHQEALIKAYCSIKKVSREEVFKKANTSNFNIDDMMRETGIILVWYDDVFNDTPLTEEQKKALSMLLSKKCISDKCLESIRCEF